MYYLGKSAGLAAGIIVGLVICVILFKFMNKDKDLKTKYDERQQSVRGRAYKYGFWGFMAGTGFIMCLDAGGIEIASRSVTLFFIMFIGLVIQVCYSIWNDGYYGINTNKKRFYGVSLVASLINLLVVVAAVREGSFFENGLISDRGINLLCVILFLIIGVELIIKDCLDKKENLRESGE